MSAAGGDVIYIAPVQMSAAVSLPDIDAQRSGGIGGFFSRHWVGLLIAGVLFVFCGPLLAGFAATFAGLFKLGDGAAEGVEEILGPIVKIVTDFVTWCENNEWVLFVAPFLIPLGCGIIRISGSAFMIWFGNRFKNPKGSMGQQREDVARLNSTSATADDIKFAKDLIAARRAHDVKPDEEATFNAMFAKFDTVNKTTAAVNKTDPTAVAAQRAEISKIQGEIDESIANMNEKRADSDKIAEDKYKLDPLGA
jgi:hypothetical protein